MSSLERGFGSEQLHKLARLTTQSAWIGTGLPWAACVPSAGSQLFLPQGSGGAHSVPCQNPALSFASELRCQVFEASSFPETISHPAGALLWRWFRSWHLWGHEFESADTLLSQVTDCSIPYNHSSAGIVWSGLGCLLSWGEVWLMVKQTFVTSGIKVLLSDSAGQHIASLVSTASFGCAHQLW